MEAEQPPLAMDVFFSRCTFIALKTRRQMILRSWHGRTSLVDADKYEAFMRERAAPDYQSVPGLIRAIFTRRDEEDGAHFLLVTIWRDLESVKQLAGDDPRKAKYYPEDDAFLLEKEHSSLNHVIFYDSEP